MAPPPPDLLGLPLNVAVTETLLLMAVTVHNWVPLQAPDQPVKVLVGFAAAAIDVDVPGETLSAQVPGQLICPSFEVTKPCPEPATLTVTTGLSARLIDTAVSAFMVSV